MIEMLSVFDHEVIELPLQSNTTNHFLVTVINALHEDLFLMMAFK